MVHDKYCLPSYCPKCGRKTDHKHVEDGDYNLKQCLVCGRKETWKGGR